MGQSYKEDPAEKAARQRERRLARSSAAAAAQDEAAGLTSDLRAVYGLRGMTGMTSPSSPAPATPGTRGPVYTSRGGLQPRYSVSLFDILSMGAR